MGTARIAKIQHYVPQMLMKHHATGNKHHLFVFDKDKQISFKLNINRIACENSFYDYQNAEGIQSIENILSKLESTASPIFDKIDKHTSLKLISTEEAGIISLFLAIQFTRTKAFREMFRSVPKQLAQRMDSTCRDDTISTIIVEQLRAYAEEEIKCSSIEFIIETAVEFSNILSRKLWLLLKTSRSFPFIIGDNPIALQNSLHQSSVLYGNLGLNAKGIEIYLPISPKISLLLLCPAYAKMPMWNFIKNAYTNGTPLTCHTQHVLNQNSLQIANAERYVMSSINDFELARRMLKNNPNLKRGPRMRIG